MAGQPAHRKPLYDWDDYRSWDDGKRWEIIGGKAYDMSPAPVIDVFLLDGPTYRLVGSYGKAHTLRSAIFEKLKINLKRVFDFPDDPEESPNALRESQPPPYRIKRRAKPSKTRT